MNNICYECAKLTGGRCADHVDLSGFDSPAIPWTTRASSVTPESLALLEARIVTVEEKVAAVKRRREEDRVGILERGDGHQMRLETLEARIDQLGRAIEADGSHLKQLGERLDALTEESREGHMDLQASLGYADGCFQLIGKRLTALEAAAAQPRGTAGKRQPRRPAPSPAKVRSRKGSSTKAGSRAASAKARTRDAGRRSLRARTRGGQT